MNLRPNWFCGECKKTEFICRYLIFTRSYSDSGPFVSCELNALFLFRNIASQFIAKVMGQSLMVNLPLHIFFFFDSVRRNWKCRWQLEQQAPSHRPSFTTNAWQIPFQMISFFQYRTQIESFEIDIARDNRSTRKLHSARRAISLIRNREK